MIRFTGVAITNGLGGSPSGVIGGAHVGYNYQINQWVVGLEGSVDGTSLSKTVHAAFPGFLFPGGITTVSASHERQHPGFDSRPPRHCLGPRLDLRHRRRRLRRVQDRLLDSWTRTVPLFANNSFSNTRVGWTVGGGIDYAVTNNWSVFAEYRYTNFGSVSSSWASRRLPRLPFSRALLSSSNRQINQNQVQVGFSYKFDTYAPPPIVAKY